MTPKEHCNTLSTNDNYKEKRRTKFDSTKNILTYDANGLITLAKRIYDRRIVTVEEVVNLSTRHNDNINGLRRAVAIILKNPEQATLDEESMPSMVGPENTLTKTQRIIQAKVHSVEEITREIPNTGTFLKVAIKTRNTESTEIDERLRSLVIEPINALSEPQRTIKGKVRTGEEIARAIPDIAAFLNEVDLQKKNDIILNFFELNESGQLVMKDDCQEAYWLDENALQAQINQTRIIYKDKDIAPQSILMARGLPTLKLDGEKHTGEYARMNKGEFEKSNITWTIDDSLDISRARYALWNDDVMILNSFVNYSHHHHKSLGSRGVLRVNLNFDLL